jgi:tetratricopeptide (TPR) repeat protein
VEQFKRMKIAVLVAVVSISHPLAAAPSQSRTPRAQPPATATATEQKVGEAYAEFLIAHRLEDADDTAGAIAAYKRAIELDPTAADIPAELAGLYLRQNKLQEAMTAAEQALKIAPANREANRVLGTIYAALSEGSADNSRGRNASGGDDNVAKAIKHLEVATDRSAGIIDPNIRATLARLYVRTGAFDKAIPLLTDLARGADAGRSAAAAGAGRLLRARATLVGCGRHLRACPRARTAQPRTSLALRVGSAQCRWPRQHHPRARHAERHDCGPARRARRESAVPAVAGAAAAR